MVKSKKTVVLIGMGGIAGSWLRAIRSHPTWDIIGIVDTDTEKLENTGKIVKELDEDDGYISIEDCVMFGEKPDLAIVCTPIPTHSGLVKEVLELDINVISEKNMASNIVQAKQMLQAAKDKPHLCTAVGTQYRYNQHNWTARRFFESGAYLESIGKLGMMLWHDFGFRGERRWSWRRFLEEVYLEDMAVHWFDTMRYVTGMDIVQVKADTFMPQYSDWHGSSTVFANLALAKPEDYHDRHKWVWCQFAGDWQRGPISNESTTRQEFYGKKGFARLTSFGMELNIYKSWDRATNDFEEDAYLAIDAGTMENMNVPYTGQAMILEMMSRGIDSGGEEQPGTNFKEAFKSFAVSVACKQSSFNGESVWVPDYWKHMLD
ncbi:MAG: Gfo/Idh/MocA family protein [Promethearchaeota archaeon]